MNIYKENYKVLKPFITNSLRSDKSYEIIERSGYLPLLVERIAKKYDYEIILLAHICNEYEDIVHDLSMSIKISHKECTAKAITYQQDRLGVYQRAADSKKTEFELNLFLRTWLNSLKIRNYIKESG